MEFKDYLYYAGAGFIALIYRVSRETGKSARYFLSLIILAVFMSIIVAPAISEYLKLTVRMTSLLSGFLVLFGNIIVDVVEKRLPTKLNEKIDKL